MKIGRLVSAILAASLFLQLACSGSGEQPLDHPAGQLPLHPIVVYGDCRSSHVIHRQIVADIMQAEPKAVFNTGDLVEDGSSARQWAMFDNITSELRETTPYYPALGNHDLPPELFFDDFDLPNNERWYSVEIEGLHFIILDTNSAIDQDSEQYKWLEAQLQSASEDFVAVVFHHPLLSTGWHGGDSDLSQILTPLFEDYRVDIVFNGHDHGYERSFKDGIYYVVTAGGGAPLRGQATTSDYSQVFDKTYNFCTLSVSSENVTVKAFDPDIGLIDEFTVEAR